MNRCWTAGFWNYLREDITFSLCSCNESLKMDLTKNSVDVDLHSDQAYLNSITLVLGQAINSCFGMSWTQEGWRHLIEELRAWSETVPTSFRAFSRASDSRLGKSLPSVWMIQDCHGKHFHDALHITPLPLLRTEWCAMLTLIEYTAAAMQYYLVTVLVMVSHIPCFGSIKEFAELPFVPRPKDGLGTIEEWLDVLALEICGIAFTNASPAVLVNAFGPIQYCTSPWSEARLWRRRKLTSRCRWQIYQG